MAGSSYTHAKPGSADIKNDEKLARLEKDVTQSQKARKEEAANASIAVSIPGLPSLSVPTRYASTLWCILVLSLLSYLYLTRLAILKQLARIARILHDLEPHNFPYRPASPYLPPWWIMPLPTANGDVVSAENFRVYLHRPSTTRGALAGVIALFVVCFALQVRVAMIGTAGIAAFGNGTRFTLEDIVLVTIIFLAVTATPILLVLWLCGMKVPDLLPPLESKVYSRRQVVIAAISFLAVSTISMGTAIMAGPKSLVQWIRKPRFRRRTKGSYQTLGLPQAVYINKRSDKFHYVMKTSRTYKHSALKPGDTFLHGVRTSAMHRPNPKNFTHFGGSPPGDSVLRDFASVSPVRRGVLMERLSDDLARSGDKMASLRTLLQAVLYDLQELRRGRRRHPNVRIYYLLARSALRSGNSAVLREMVVAINKSSHRELFSKALRSWTDPSSRWRKRLAYVTDIGPRVDLLM